MDFQEKNFEFIAPKNLGYDITLEKCCFNELNINQSVTINVPTGYCLITAVKGKAVVNYSDKRNKLIFGNAIIAPFGYNIQIKADGIDTFSFISIYISGEKMKSLCSMIENKEKSIIMDISKDTRLFEYASDLLNECHKPHRTDLGILSAFYQYLNVLDYNYNDQKAPSKNIYMVKAIDYIKSNYNKNISVENIAELLGIERSYLSRLFKTYKNKSTQNYIIDFRINKAKILFQEEDMNVSQVSVAVGYTNIYCFSRIFKSRVGMPPKEYMEKCRKNLI